MKKSNQIEFKVTGKYALFSDPLTRVGGEKLSYQIPTYEALKGIVKSIYFKPTISWFIDEVRVMKPIQTRTKGIRPIDFSGGNTLSYYTYLYEVEYYVKAHFEWNLNHPELESDRNENKHYFIAKRMVEKGGRRDVFLGCRECQAYVEPCNFDEGEGMYDHLPELSFGLMFHGFTYPDEIVKEEEKGKMVASFWKPVMKNGVIHFIRPEECEIRRVIKEGTIKMFEKNMFTQVDVIKEVGDDCGLGE